MSLGLIFIIEVCARLCESSTASGASVGDITPGIPKYHFIMTNIYSIYQVVYARILKSSYIARSGRIISSRAIIKKLKPEYKLIGPAC
jgi:hypothetical protein